MTMEEEYNYIELFFRDFFSSSFNLLTEQKIEYSGS